MKCWFGDGEDRVIRDEDTANIPSMLRPYFLTLSGRVSLLQVGVNELTETHTGRSPRVGIHLVGICSTWSQSKFEEEV